MTSRRLLTLRYAAACTLVLVAFGVSMGYLLVSQGRAHGVSEAERMAVRTAEVSIQPLFEPGDLSGSPLAATHRAEVAEALGALVDGQHVLHLNVMDANGTILFADREELIGSVGHSSQDRAAALAGGTVSGRTSEFGGSLEVYVPLILTPGDGPAGVFELYVPLAATDAVVARDTTLALAVLVAGLLSLYLVVTRILRRAGDALAKSLQDQEELARRDSLTGLPNRLAFQEQMAAATAGADGEIAVLILDVDDFKAVNDSFGHREGDRLLVIVATRLLEAASDDVAFARLGGDEFAAVATGPDPRAAVRRVLASIEGAALLIGGSRVDVHASAGFVLAPVGSDPAVLLHRADLAMYDAKRAGDGAREWHDSMDDGAAARLELLSDLRTAVAGEEMQIWVQPAIDLLTDTVVGVEVLLRWEHPEHGLLSPDAFVPLAEQTDVIDGLGDWSLDQAMAWGARWHALGLDLTVAVNVSARQVRLDLPTRVRTSLERHALPASRLCLEVTETSLPPNMASAARVLEEITRLGVEVAVDDFGTGFATLEWLRHLPFQAMKIDKSFTAELARTAGSIELVRHVVSLGHALGMSVVGEGVETPLQLELLRDLGADSAQGYLIAEPMPAAALVGWLAARTAATPPGREVVRRSRLAPAG